MIIDHFCTFPHGGAGTAARRLHERLRDTGIDSRFNYWKDQTSQDLGQDYRRIEFVELKSVNPLSRKLEKRRRRQICDRYDKHLATRPDNFELFTIPWTLERTKLKFSRELTDIVHLHWTAFFIDYPSFFASIPDAVPIVWSLHDMNPLTGGCHYSSGCSRFTVGCGNCPQISEPSPRDVSFEAFRDKQRSLRKKKIHVITPNQWLSQLAQHSRIFPNSTEFHVIRLGLDENVFKPTGKLEARQRLGIDSEKTLIAFGAEDIENYRKGFHHLLAALRDVHAQRPIECLVFGSGQLPSDRIGLPKFHDFGFIESDERQSLVYSAADMFVLPSREDNQPQTGLESMACGTPVVGFRAGGIPEYVIPHQSGLLAAMGNEHEMAEQIIWLIDHPSERIQISKTARQLITASFTAEQQSQNYINLYENILGSRTPLDISTSQNQPKAA